MAKIINVEDIEDGMVNPEPIVNKFGQTLLSAGTTLSQRHVLILKTWNIRTVRVKSDSDESLEISEEALASAKQKLMRRIRWTPSLPIEDDLILSGAIIYAKKSIKSKETQ